MTPANDNEKRIVVAIRRVIRYIDLYSRKIHAELGLTTPQLLCLDALNKNDHMITKELAGAVNLSESTLIGIVDRLEAKQYLTRTRSREDRRKVYLSLTASGKEILHHTPFILQDRLSTALENLSEEEQGTITRSLERLADLMEAGGPLVPLEYVRHDENIMSIKESSEA